MLRDLGNQQIDALADDFGLAVAEHALTSGIEGANDALFVHGKHDVLDVIEDDLQMLRALCAHFLRERTGLISHEAHGLHDATPLFIDSLVMRADEPKQRAEVDDSGAAAQAQLAKLAPKMGVEIGAVFTTERAVHTNGSGRTGGDRLRGARGIRILRIDTRPEVRRL